MAGHVQIFDAEHTAARYDRQMKNLFTPLLAVAFLCTGAWTAPDDEALALFVAGEYAAVAERAESIGDAENLAMAAQALNAQAYLQQDNKRAKKILKRSLKLADAAAEADPALVEAHLQSAIAMAQRGSRMSAARAFFLGLGPGARERLDAALGLAPDNPAVLSTSAGWHLGVAARAGNGRFGADAATGRAQFLAARAGDPDSISIAYEMALRLLAYGEPAWRAEALAALEEARVNPAPSAFEKAVQKRAHTFADSIENGPEAEVAYIDAQP